MIGNPTHTGSPSPRCFAPTDSPWSAYDPYYDRYVANDGTALEDGTADTDGTVHILSDGQIRNTHSGSPAGTGLDSITTGIGAHNRGYKGIGPALTEPEDEYACTIHSRECKLDPASNTLIDSTGSACTYGTFQIRLNSSPGTKHVRRQYLGESDERIEEEAVYIVISPDPTPQTRFEPTSVTFTHTGGAVEGHDSQRWDEPTTITVIPVDDVTDERAGVTIDFTSFTITQSHFGEFYWDYTTPYQTTAAVGTMTVTAAGAGMCTTDVDTSCAGENSGDAGITEPCFQAVFAAGYAHDACLAPCGAGTAPWNTGARVCQACEDIILSVIAACTAHSGRADTHTPFRHHIRTIHTFDNDFAGVRIESLTGGTGGTDAAITQTLESNGNYYTHSPVDLEVTEGDTFAFYTLRLDTQPRKVQRQAGTNPNTLITPGAPGDIGASCDIAAACLDDPTDFFAPDGGCAAVVAAGSIGGTSVSCSTDLATVNAGWPIGTLLSMVCPATCGTGTECHATSGTYTGATFTGFDFSNGGSDTTLNEDLLVEVDGASAETISIGLNADSAEKTGVLVSYLTGATASGLSGSVIITSESTGPASTVDIVINGRYTGASLAGYDFSVPATSGTYTGATFAAFNFGPSSGTYTGATFAAFDFTNGGSDTTLNEDLIVTVDGGSPETITLATDITSAADAVTALAGLTGATASDVGGLVVITSDSTGTSSTVAIDGAGSGANAVALFGTGTAVDGVAAGGGPGTLPGGLDTLIKHYVETEDTPDNMQRNGYVQRNKHGGQYTSGNLERYPFGLIDPQEGVTTDLTMNRITGRTTFGYTDYQTLHGFVQPATQPFPDAARGCVGIACMGMLPTQCCSAVMGMVGLRSSVAWQNRGSLGLSGYSSNIPQDGIGSPSAGWSRCPGYALSTDNTALCTEGITGNSEKQPWQDDGTPCYPVFDDDDPSTALALCEPKFATVAGRAGGTGEAGGMKFPPIDVTVTVNDQDEVVTESASAGYTANCRQTQLFHNIKDAATTALSDETLMTTQWLVDYNCPNSDAGVLPGYPLRNADGSA